MLFEDADLSRLYRPLALKFFGRDALIGSDGLLRGKLKPFIRMIAVTTWENFHKTWLNKHVKVKKDHADLLNRLAGEL